MLNDNVQVGITQRRHDTTDVRLRNQCTGRTTSYALTAVDATRHVNAFVEGGADDGFGAAIDKINAGNTLYFVADPNAFAALDTLFAVSNNGFAGRVDGISFSLSDESSPVNTECLGKFPKLAVGVPLAKEAIIGMVCKEQFDDGSPGIDNAVGLGFDLHASTNGKGTGGDKASLSFDFDNADAAGTCWRKSFVVAEGWHINSGTAECVEQYFAGGGIDLTTIDFDLNGLGHIRQTKNSTSGTLYGTFR